VIDGFSVVDRTTAKKVPRSIVPFMSLENRLPIAAGMVMMAIIITIPRCTDVPPKPLATGA